MTQEAAGHLDRLELVAAGLTGAVTVDDVAEIALAQGLAAVAASGVLVGLVDGDGLVLHAARGWPSDVLAPFRTMPLDADLPLAEAARTRAPVWVEDEADRAGRFPGLADVPTPTPVSASLPLVVSDDVIGVLGVGFPAGRHVGDEDRRFLLTLADLCALALQRLVVPHRDLPPPPSLDVLADPRRLAEIARLGLLERTTRRNLDRLTALAARLLGGRMAQISIIAARELVVSVYGLPMPIGTTPLDKTICSLTTASRRPLRIEGAAEHPWVRDLPPVRNGGVARYLGVPVVTARGEAVGALCVFDDGQAPWPADGEAVLAELAEAVVTAAEFDVRSTLLERAVDRAGRLQRVTHALGAATTPDDVDRVLAETTDTVSLEPELSALVAQTRQRVTALADLRRSERDLRAATDQLQSSLLPSSLPDHPHVDLAAAYLPAGALLDVGGDFYDAWLPDGDGRLWAVIGDVVGKGAEAAALTGLARHTLRAVAGDVAGPAEALARLNRAMLTSTGEATFCTAAALRLTPDGGDGRVRARVALGGHPPPLVVRAGGTVEPVGLRGDLVGVWPEARYREVELDLAPGDLVVLYTDGVTEARGAGGLLGDDRLNDVLAACPGAAAADVVARVTQEVVRFRDGSTDDVAVLVLRARER